MKEIEFPKGTEGLMITEFGSHLYGLSTPTSDKDYKGVYIPKMKNWVLNNYPDTVVLSTGDKHGKNTSTDVDIDLYSMQKFIKDALKGETYALDMLHATAPMFTSPIWDEIVKNRKKFYSRNMKSLIGYAAKQAHKYGIKGSRLASIEAVLTVLNTFDEEERLEEAINPGQPLQLIAGELEHTEIVNNEDMAYLLIIGKQFGGRTRMREVKYSLQKQYDEYGHRAQLAKDNAGIDWKAISHALRATYQQRDIFNKGDFSYPLAENSFLRQVKQGELDFITVVQPALETAIEEVLELAEVSELPDEPDRQFWETFIWKTFHTL